MVVSETGTAPTLGDARLVERLVANLVDNAVRYNTPGGSVHVVVSAVDTRAVLRVVNTGPIVRQEEVARIMQPFQRLGPDRSGGWDGNGMGLSIVAAIAAAHGAALTVRARAGGGLDVHVMFPPVPAARPALSSAVV
jgi:signal transduction histidine kinase